MIAAERRAPHGALVLLIPALTLGVLVGTQLRTQAERPALAGRYQITLLEAVRSLEQEQARLRAELVDLRAGLDAIQSDGARLDTASAALRERIQGLSREAGLVEERGPGVVVTLDDARLPATTIGIERGIVHAQDLTDVFNAGWRGGARAISVNGERITAASACVGATIQINGVLMSPPFVVTIIGTPEPLLAALTEGSDLADLRARRDLFGLGLDVSRVDVATAPAYTGALAVRFAESRP